MDLRFVHGDPDDERIAAIITLAIEAYLGAQTRQAAEPMTRGSRWIATGRLEARGLPLLSARRKKGWGTRG